MAKKTITIKIPDWIAARLNQEKDRDDAVAEALDLYYSQKVMDYIDKMSLAEGLQYSNALARKSSPVPLTAKEIVKLIHRGRDE